ncbi:MAG: hypothetical protein IID34_13385 [Planctomycetes bacterium]|nr:hypothetical protein [Planctomycetota bacterium]
MGTMAAGAGITVDSRVRNRIELWKQHIKVHPGALSIAVSDEGELAAVALGYLLDSGTLQLAREGRMDYTRLVPGQQIADNEDERYGVYIAVTIGDHAHLKRLERNGSDLVGALLARHIAGLIGFSNLSLDRAVLITDGFRGLSLRAYMRKGFRKIGTKNPHGYPVLELNMSESQHEPFVIAIREAQVLERMASYSE